jgi:hypothetical protein
MSNVTTKRFPTSVDIFRTCRTMLTRLLGLICVSLVLAPGAYAEIYCVNSSAQILAAITSANGGVNSEIRIQSGFYNFTSPANGVAIMINDTADLIISGGWNASCTAVNATSADSTVLNVQNTGRLLEVNFAAGTSHEVAFTLLGFRGGQSSGLDAGCVQVNGTQAFSTPSGAKIRFDLNAFRLCTSNGAGSALQVIASNMETRVRGNMLTDNASANGALWLRGVGQATFYVSNNTIANNVGGEYGGMQLASDQSGNFFWLSNNVAWRNGSPIDTGFDLLVSGSVAGIFNNNLFGRTSAIPVGVVNNNMITSDPLFTNVVDFRPRRGSPLVDAGINSPAGGNNAVDFDLLPRIQGARVDIGAYELSQVFANGFE